MVQTIAACPCQGGDLVQPKLCGAMSPHCPFTRTLHFEPLLPQGESYGGVYIPLLAHRILHYNHHLEQQQQQQQQPQKHQQQQQSGQEPQTASMAGHVKEQPMRQAFQGDTASSGASAAADGQSTSLPHQHVSRQLLAASYDRGYHHRVNLVGYMVGNGVTDDEVDGNSLVRGLLSCSEFLLLSNLNGFLAVQQKGVLFTSHCACINSNSGAGWLPLSSSAGRLPA